MMAELIEQRSDNSEHCSIDIRSPLRSTIADAIPKPTGLGMVSLSPLFLHCCQSGTSPGEWGAINRGKRNRGDWPCLCLGRQSGFLLAQWKLQAGSAPNASKIVDLLRSVKLRGNAVLKTQVVKQTEQAFTVRD